MSDASHLAQYHFWSAEQLLLESRLRSLVAHYFSPELIRVFAIYLAVSLLLRQLLIVAILILIPFNDAVRLARPVVLHLDYDLHHI